MTVQATFGLPGRALWGRGGGDCARRQVDSLPPRD